MSHAYRSAQANQHQSNTVVLAPAPTSKNGRPGTSASNRSESESRCLSTSGSRVGFSIPSLRWSLTVPTELQWRVDLGSPHRVDWPCRSAKYPRDKARRAPFKKRDQIAPIFQGACEESCPPRLPSCLTATPFDGSPSRSGRTSHPPQDEVRGHRFQDDSPRSGCSAWS